MSYRNNLRRQFSFRSKVSKTEVNLNSDNQLGYLHVYANDAMKLILEKVNDDCARLQLDTEII